METEVTAARKRLSRQAEAAVAPGPELKATLQAADGEAGHPDGPTPHTRQRRKDTRPSGLSTRRLVRRSGISNWSTIPRLECFPLRATWCLAAAEKAILWRSMPTMDRCSGRR